MNDKLFIRLQHWVPQHALSRWAGAVANSKIGFIKNTFITWFIKRYNVDMSIAVEEIRALTNPLMIFLRAHSNQEFVLSVKNHLL